MRDRLDSKTCGKQEGLIMALGRSKLDRVRTVTRSPNAKFIQ